MQLPTDQSFSTIPVFTLTKGKIAKTSGSFDDITVIYCAADGVMTLSSYGEIYHETQFITYAKKSGRKYPHCFIRLGYRIICFMGR